MLPLLILIVPPTLAGGGYLSWYVGWQLVHRRKDQPSDPPPPQSTASYASGLIALVGTYGLSERLISRSSGRSDAVTTTNTTASSAVRPRGKGGGFVPPRSVGELLSRAGPPVLMRLAAASASFFCAGAVQAYVSSPSGPDERRAA